MHSTLFLPATLQLTATVLLAIVPFISATRSSSLLEPRDVFLPQGWVSLGCYSDDPTQRTLTSLVMTKNAEMSIWLCVYFCKDHGKSYAGLEYGSDCFCGNVLTDGAKSMLEMECLTPCTGDNTRYCGGTDRLSLYSNGAPQYAPPTMPDHVDFWTLMGCFDDADSGTLTHPVTLAGGQYSNSAENCISTCKSGGYIVAGMKSAGECRCDQTINGSKDPTDPSKCMLACPANSFEACGGPNSITVYADILPH